jgi:hypothetical protein
VPLYAVNPSSKPKCGRNLRRIVVWVFCGIAKTREISAFDSEKRVNGVEWHPRVSAKDDADCGATVKGPWCPPNVFTGKIKACGTSSTTVVARFGGQASLVVNKSGLRAGVEGVGTATFFARLCATVDVGTSHIDSITFSPSISGRAFSAMAYVDKWNAQTGTWDRSWGVGVNF